MEWLPGSEYQYWALGLVTRAATDCTPAFLWVLAGLEMLVLAGWALTRRGSGPRASFLLLAALAAAFAWAARDQNFLLGDSRVWIQNAAVAGRNLPADRAPVSALVLGLAVDLAGGFFASQTVLGLLSVILGIGTAAVVWRIAAAEAPGSTLPAVLAVLALFCTPIGFNHLGHIEAYPLLMFLMAVFLAVLRRDLARGGTYFASLTVLIVMVFFHYVAALLAVPVLAALAAGRKLAWRRLAAAYLGLLVAAYAVFALIPPLREHTLLVRTGGVAAFVDYGWDLANMWLLLFVPLGVIARRVADRVVTDLFGRTLLLVAITFIAFPVFADFELGGYRDLDLMGPALLALTVFCAVGAARGGLRGRFPGGWFALGAVFLAGIQTLTLCPAGAAEMERHLRREIMEPEARANAEEILSYFYREHDDWPRARVHAERALAAMPGNLRQWGPLGEIQLALGDTAAAVESLTRAMGSHRAGRTAPLLGELLTQQGRPDRAIEVLESVRDEALRTVRGSAALAVAYYEAGRPESTLAVARERLDIDPKDATAYYNGASALSRLGDGEGALQALTMATRLDPDNVHYHRVMVRFLLTLPEGDLRARTYLGGLDPALADSVAAGW